MVGWKFINSWINVYKWLDVYKWLVGMFINGLLECL